MDLDSGQVRGTDIPNQSVPITTDPGIPGSDDILPAGSTFLVNAPKVIVPSLFLSIRRNIPRAIGRTCRFNSRFSSFDRSSFSEIFIFWF